MNWQAVFFDFDGVIVDSAPIKTAAFAIMFRPYGEVVEKAVIAYHLDHQGLSRFNKFRYIYNHILNIPLDEQKLKELGNDFSEIVLEAVVNASYLPGVLETLNELKSLEIPAYIVSGTPDYEIKDIVHRRNLSTFFQGVYGSPREKVEIIEELLDQKGYLPSRCLFIGDSPTDYNAANDSGTHFLGIVMNGFTSPFPDGTWISPRITIER